MIEVQAIRSLELKHVGDRSFMRARDEIFTVCKDRINAVTLWECRYWDFNDQIGKVLGDLSHF